MPLHVAKGEQAYRCLVLNTGVWGYIVVFLRDNVHTIRISGAVDLYAHSLDGGIALCAVLHVIAVSAVITYALAAAWPVESCA